VACFEKPKGLKMEMNNQPLRSTLRGSDTAQGQVRCNESEVPVRLTTYRMQADHHS
jgi:hypothetical protein